jgi:hypothetical protein
MCLLPSSVITLMMDALRTSETSIYFKETARRYIPEDCNIQAGDIYTLLVQ